MATVRVVETPESQDQTEKQEKKSSKRKSKRQAEAQVTIRRRVYARDDDDWDDDDDDDDRDDEYEDEPRSRSRSRRIVINQSIASPRLQPIVLDWSDGKRRKRRGSRYSRGTRDVQVVGRGLARSARDIAGAVEEGFDTYLRERDRSAKRRRDGALVDFIPNVGEGLSATLREASRVPRDLSQTLNTRRVRRFVRRRVRRNGRLLDRFFLL